MNWTRLREGETCGKTSILAIFCNIKGRRKGGNRGKWKTKRKDIKASSGESTMRDGTKKEQLKHERQDQIKAKDHSLGAERREGRPPHCFRQR